ncbi:MAG: hypothetical protein KDB22_28345 [Planctomycetales bacterium]|nr:hypothetical protein [Planctomycetales bacterium]
MSAHLITTPTHGLAPPTPIRPGGVDGYGYVRLTPAGGFGKPPVVGELTRGLGFARSPLLVALQHEFPVKVFAFGTVPGVGGRGAGMIGIPGICPGVVGGMICVPNGSMYFIGLLWQYSYKHLEPASNPIGSLKQEPIGCT